jgi:hypothetical protein
MSVSIDFTFCCTGEGHWENCNDFGGVAVGVGISLPKGGGLDFTSANVWASPIEKVVDVPVNPYECEAQQWQLEIDAAHQLLSNVETGTSGMIGVFVFDTEKEFKDAMSTKGLGRHVSTRCGGHIGHEDYNFASHFRPYAVQVVNFSGDAFLIDQLWLRRTGGSGGIADEKYQWGMDNGAGWLLDNDGEAKSSFSSAWQNSIGSQDRGYNSMTFSIGKGTGTAWDVPCVKSGGNCGDKVEVQYTLVFDTEMCNSGNAQFNIFIDEKRVGIIRHKGKQETRLYVDYQPSFDHIRVQAQNTNWGTVDWMRVETRDKDNRVCKDSHHDWFFGRDGGGSWCISIHEHNGSIWHCTKSSNGKYFQRYFDFKNDGQARVYGPSEDGNGSELVAEIIDSAAY